MSSDIPNVLIQQLRSWSQAGLSHLPKARYSQPRPGDHSISEVAAGNPSRSVATEIAASSSTGVAASTATGAHAVDFISSAEDNYAAAASSANVQTPPTSRVGSQGLLGGWQIGVTGSAIDVRPYPVSLRIDERQHQLGQLALQVAGCRRCAILSGCRTQTVFGVGNPQPRLVLFGEAPGAEEDQQGEPFVGAAGQLLNKIIQACQMRREDVYIMNTVKCRPPQNRNPNPDEMENCWEYAERQFEILQPEFICCLGKVAAQRLLKTEAAISRLRGRWFNYRGSRVMVTYHPAYLLRTPSAKKATWDDMKMLLKEMGIELPQA